MALSISPGMASVLRVIRGPLEGSVYVLGDRTRIGRAVDAHIQLTEAGVSRHHARIVRRNDGSFHLADLSSKAGTLVDGEAVVQHALSADERITIGATEFVFEERDGEPLSSSPRFGDKVRGFSVVRATECFMPMPSSPSGHGAKPTGAAEAGVAESATPAGTAAANGPKNGPDHDPDDVVPYAPGYAQHEEAQPNVSRCATLSPSSTAARKPRRRSTKKNLSAVEDAPRVSVVVRESWAAADADAPPAAVRLAVEHSGRIEEDALFESAPVVDNKPSAEGTILEETEPVAQAVLVREPQAGASKPAPAPELAPTPAPKRPAPSFTPTKQNVPEPDAPLPSPPVAQEGSNPGGKGSSSGPHIGVGADPEARERGLKILREVLEYRDLRLRDLRGEALSASKRARYDSLQLRLMNTVGQADLPGSRRYQRFSCSLPACILQRDGEFSRTLDVELEDLSAGGARITASDPAIRVGDEVWLAFNLAALFSYGQKVVFRCRVVWTRPHHAKLGLMFGGTARFAATLEDATKDP